MIFELLLLLTACGVHGLVSWGTWSKWTTSCPRSCSDMFGLQIRHRICLICQREYDCFPASRPTSISLCTGHYRETRHCYVGAECEGQGRFTGEWSSWEEFGACMTSSPGCDVPGEQYLTRSCVPHTDSKSASDVQCPLTADAHTFKLTECVKECPLQKSVTKREITTNLSLYWTEWSNWRCDMPCMSPKVQAVRHRKCREGGGVSLLSSCTLDVRDKIDYDKRPCLENNIPLCVPTARNNFTSDLLPLEITPHRQGRVKREDVDGNWGNWASWSRCSVSCELGTRSRHRYCDSPKPQGNGKTCPGHNTYEEECEEEPCPRDGQWGEWAAYTCSATCGTGIRLRYRYCDKPTQEGTGKPCPGSNKEVSDKPCTLFDCPQHSTAMALPDNVVKVVKEYLQKEWRHYDLRTMHDKTHFYLSTSNKARIAIGKTYPYGAYVWTLNGHPLPQNMYFRDIDTRGNLRVPYVGQQEQGVYMGQIQWSKGMRATFTIASVVTVSDDVMYVHPGDNVQLPCNGAPLGMIFSGLRQFWFQDGNIYKDYGSTPPQLANVEYFKDVQPSFKGLWECVVTEVNSDRMWITNRVNVSVLPYTLIERVFPDREHFYVVLALVVIAVLASLTCCIYQSKTSEKEAEEEAKVFQSVLAETGGLKKDQTGKDNLTDSSLSDTSVDSQDTVPLLDGGRLHKDTLLRT